MPEPAGPTSTSTTRPEDAIDSGRHRLVVVQAVCLQRLQRGGRDRPRPVAARGEKPALGVEDDLGRVALGTVVPEGAGAIAAAQRIGRGRLLGRGEQDGAGGDGVHDLGQRAVPVCGGVEAVGAKQPGGLRVDVPRRPRRPLGGQRGQDLAGEFGRA